MTRHKHRPAPGRLTAPEGAPRAPTGGQSWRDVLPIHPAARLTWRDVLAAAARGPGQNASKRAAIERMLRAHPDWSNRRIAQAIHMLIITDDDLEVQL
jgi:hypothetical protein